MNKKIRRRFIEKDYIKSIEMQNRTYITEDEIDHMLNSVGEIYDDFTFIFEETKTGWKTKIIDNDLDQEITLKDVHGFALDFYVKQIASLTKEKFGLQQTA